DEALHLARDVGVALVHVETMHALAMRAHEADELGIAAVGDVVEAEAAIRIILLAELARLELGIHRHDIARDAHLVAVRGGMARHDRADEARSRRILDIEDRGPLGPFLIADIGVAAGDREPAGMPHIGTGAWCRADIRFGRAETRAHRISSHDMKRIIAALCAGNRDRP